MSAIVILIESLSDRVTSKPLSIVMDVVGVPDTSTILYLGTNESVNVICAGSVIVDAPVSTVITVSPTA